MIALVIYASSKIFICLIVLQSKKRANIRNLYNQAPHLTQDTNGKVTTSQLDITNESQEASPFSAGDHKASINRHARKHNKNKTDCVTKIVSEYDQEIPQSQTADNPIAPPGRAAQPSRDTRKTN